MRKSQAIGMIEGVPARNGWVRDWQRWVPYAAGIWSLIYAALGIYWAVRGRGFPYAPAGASDVMAPVLGRFEPGVIWTVVMMAGLPAVAMGVLMLGRVRSRAIRTLLITAGTLLAGVLMLLMTSLNLLVLLGYIPYVVRGLFSGDEVSQRYLMDLTQWTTIHQLVCLLGGFLWLAATVTYSRRSAGACPYCGRRDGPEGWQRPDQAGRWGRTAVVVAMFIPVFYAITRYAWALGFPLGMTDENLRHGQESGMWTSGLFLATFGLVGAILMLGLVQHWGEVFPRWMIGLAGRRVPIALAVVPASLVSVLLVGGGVGIWSGLAQMVAGLAAGGVADMEIFWEIFIQVGPTLLFPVWGVALAVATLGYYYRRRGPCKVCGRGGLSQPTQLPTQNVI
jgi:hypothetical protein